MSLSCEENSDENPPPGNDSLFIEDAFSQLQFIRPVDLQHAGDANLYVVEQRGVIQLFENNPSVSTKKTFLDIQDRVNDQENEQGLLGLAFHPDYNSNDFFYVNYTSNNNTTRISRFQVNPSNRDQALPASELILLEFDQPFGNHNGGQLLFASDGYLYIAVGDGGSGGDPLNHGQTRSTLLGSILRIDVDRNQGGNNYGIPADNPFANNQQGFREEIYAYGLRNPWRMSFDPVSAQLWAADVGQGDFEEIDIITNGGNYGWKVVEGPDCFRSSNCDQSEFTSPYFHYSHDNGDLSITGGVVYRGSINSLEGRYIYADYVSGRIWALDTSTPDNQLLFNTNHRISSFGVDHIGELYFCDLNGKILKISN